MKAGSHSHLHSARSDIFLLKLQMMAGALGLEPRWTFVVGFGDQCNRRYATPLYGVSEEF